MRNSERENKKKKVHEKLFLILDGVCGRELDNKKTMSRLARRRRWSMEEDLELFRSAEM